LRPNKSSPEQQENQRMEVLTDMFAGKYEQIDVQQENQRMEVLTYLQVWDDGKIICEAPSN